jgi:hypothetical protein
MGFGRHVTRLSGALGTLNCVGRRHNQEPDSQGHGWEHNREKKEVVGERVHADLQSATRGATGVPRTFRRNIAKSGQILADGTARGGRAGTFSPGPVKNLGADRAQSKR